MIYNSSADPVYTLHNKIRNLLLFIQKHTPFKSAKKTNYFQQGKGNELVSEI